MSTKRLVQAGTAGTMALWILACVWHRLLLGPFYVENLFPGNGFRDANVLLLFLAYTLLAFLMAWIYPIGYRGGRPASEGLRFGLVMGLLSVAPMSLMVYAAHEVTGIGVVVDMSWHLIIEEPLGGMVIGLVWGRGARGSAGRHDSGSWKRQARNESFREGP